MNPLTTKKKLLPRLCRIDGVEPDFQSMMVQLSMDKQTRQYKVFVVGYVKKIQCAQVYDSVTKQDYCRTRRAVMGSFLDVNSRSERQLELRGPCVYDFADELQTFANLKSIMHPEDSKPGPYAFLNNHPFVLCGDVSPGRPIGYYISEYVFQKNATVQWVKVQEIGNFLFENASNDPINEDSEDSDSDYYRFTAHVFTLQMEGISGAFFDGIFLLDDLSVGETSDNV